MKKFFLLNLKKKIPLFVIVLVIFAIVALFSAVNVKFFIEYRRDPCFGCNQYYAHYDDINSGIEEITIVLLSLMLILPFFGMSYRYSSSKSDIYRQVACKKNNIRWIEHLTLLISTLISFTIAYFLMVSIIAIRNANAVAPESVNQIVYYEIDHFYYGYYFLAYLVLVVAASLQYFITYLIISRSNNLVNSILLLMIGELFLALFIHFTSNFFFLTDQNGDKIQYLMWLGGVASNASFIMPISLVYRTFNGLIIMNETENIYAVGSMTSSEVNAVLNYVGTFAYAGLGILGIISFIFEKDPSSEFANKPQTHKPFQEIIFHLGFGVGTAALIMLDRSILSISLKFVLMGATYYTLYGLLERNFKLNLRQTLTMIGVLLSSLIIPIIYIGMTTI